MPYFNGTTVYPAVTRYHGKQARGTSLFVAGCYEIGELDDNAGL
jgi:hypothetical protein